MGSRIGVAVMAVLLVLYIALVGWRAFVLLGAGEPVAIAMGIALLVMPLIGVWALVRELQFGVAAERLGRRLDGEGGMPEAPAEVSPNGRLRKDDAERMIREYDDAAAQDPADWRARYRLGVVHEAAGNRKLARAAIREAIRLSRTAV